MPRKTFENPGETYGIGIGLTGRLPLSSYDNIHDADEGREGRKGEIIVYNNKSTLPGRPGQPDITSFSISRGFVSYDFSRVDIIDGKTGAVRSKGFDGVPTNIKILKANLLLSNGVRLEGPGDAGGDKIVVGIYRDSRGRPTEARIRTAEYGESEQDISSFTRPIQLPDRSRTVVPLENRKLLNALENAINEKSFVHLCIRNHLDFIDFEPTSVNSIFFEAPDVARRSFVLEIIFQTNSARFEQGKGAFGGSNIRNASGKGFGSF